MDYKYELTRPDSPSYKMKTNSINGLVRVTNNYIRDGIKYLIKVRGIPLYAYITMIVPVWDAPKEVA